MEQSNIKILIEKYFDGETSLAEEQQIASYLRKHDNLPEEWQALKIMMGAAEDIRKTHTPIETPLKQSKKSHPVWLNGFISGAIAASIAIGIVLFWTLGSSEPIKLQEPIIICYKDGHLVDNQMLARTEVKSIFNDVSNDLELAMKCIQESNILQLTDINK